MNRQASLPHQPLARPWPYGQYSSHDRSSFSNFKLRTSKEPFLNSLASKLRIRSLIHFYEMPAAAKWCFEFSCLLILAKPIRIPILLSELKWPKWVGCELAERPIYKRAA